MVSNMPHLSVMGLQKFIKRNAFSTTKNHTNYQTPILKKKRKKFGISKKLNAKLKKSQSSYDMDFVKLVKCMIYSTSSKNKNRIQHNFGKKATNEEKSVVLQPSKTMLGAQIDIESKRSVNIIEMCPICRKQVIHIDNDENISIYNSSCSQKHQLENTENHSRINHPQHLLEDFYSRTIRERISPQFNIRLQINGIHKKKCWFGACSSCKKTYLQRIHGIDITEPNVRQQSICFTNCAHQKYPRRTGCCQDCRILYVNKNKQAPLEFLPKVPHAVSYYKINNNVTYMNGITSVPERMTKDKTRSILNAIETTECTEKCDYKKNKLFASSGKCHCFVAIHKKFNDEISEIHHTKATANTLKSCCQDITTNILKIMQFVFIFLQIQLQSNNFQKINILKRQQQLPLHPQQQLPQPHKQQQQERGSSSIRLITYFLNSYNHTNNNNNNPNNKNCNSKIIIIINNNNINNSSSKSNQQQKLLPSLPPPPPQLQHYQIKETQKNIYYHYIKNKNKKICKSSSTFSVDEGIASAQNKDLNGSDPAVQLQNHLQNTEGDASKIDKKSETYKSNGKSVNSCYLPNKSLKKANSSSLFSSSSHSTSTRLFSVLRLELIKKMPKFLYPRNIVILLSFLMFLLPVTCAQTSLSAPSIRSSSTRSSGNVRLAKNEVVCQSMDLRNSPLSFSALKNCTVIEGFLLFTLVNTKGQEEFNETYPLLVEVTEYVIVYRVHKLRSLGQLFPNLSIIRGEELFLSQYALVVFSNPDLLELGLTKLTAIPRGGVRLQGNKNLCFANTLDWHEITSDGSEIKIKDNRPTDDCPRCPGGYMRNEESDASEVMLTCKESSGIYPCWNSTICQTICPRECPRNCFDEKTCCNPACLGGCTSNPNQCASCRYFSINSTTCVDECPPNTYNYLNRRCISAETCKLIKKRYYGNKETDLVAFNGTCSVSCPPQFKLINSTCEPCGGICKRICEGAVIDDITRAKQFEGCTEIVKYGLSISIKIGGSHVTDALRKALSSIQTIRTYLKVHNTYGMGSLSFFENLKSIGGETLLDDKFALYVLDNNDLSEIWGANHTVVIENGTIYFHFNPKLCVNTIYDLIKKNSTQISPYEVSEESNGSKVSCNNVTLNATVTKIESNNVDIVIENPPEIHDQRTFIGYQLLLMEYEHKNATKFTYGPCEDKWNITEPYKTNSTNIGGLQPYTQYAFYIKSKFISSEKGNVESAITYFTTKSAQPKPVRAFKAYAITDTEISISWLPPRTTNGKLVNYIVSIKIDNRKSADTRDYCKLIDKPDIEIQATTKKPPVEVPAGKCEVVPDSQSGSGGGRNRGNTFVDDEKEIDEFIYFENAVQNLVFRKREKYPSNKNNISNSSNNAIRRRRNLDFNTDQVLLSRLPRDVVKTNVSLMDETGRYYKEIIKNVSVVTTKYTFKELKPFSRYYVSVEACREPEEGALGNECSNPILYDVKTLKKENVDIVRNFEASFEGTNSSRGTVRLRWDPPEYPNGDVVSYTIEYQLDATESAYEKKCITQREYLKQPNGYYLNNLATGNYSIRVRANTLAGNGIFTAFKYVYIKPLQLSATVIALIAVGVLLCVLCCIGSGMLMRKKFLSPQLDLIMNPTINPDYLMQPYIPDDWEVPRERILQLNPLGQGSFGMVYEGLLKSYNNSTEDTLCAIKTTNEHATDRERANFLEEASVMKQFDTHHVVRLLGVCSLGQPALVIMELMRNGDLKSYLRAHRPDEQRGANGLPMLTGGAQPPPLSRIYQMAIEIADGMAYLAAKKFVHRDLAARNCMVAADLTVKIGDFGMTRDIYETDYYRKGTKGLLPVRWMPPESLRDGVYSNASDVFSYGVVLWEMATLAAQPYQGYSNDQVLHHVIDGGVMERPDNCSDRLYSLMQKCWLYRPSARPTFMEIIRMLYDMADPRFEEVSFYNSPEGQQQLNKELLSKSHNVDDMYDDRDNNMDDATTPLHVGDYSGYKLDMANNSSIEHQDESPMITCDDNLHSPYSLGSVMIVNSASDGQSKNSFSLSQKLNNPNASVGGARGPPPQYSSTSNIKLQHPTHHQYKSLQGQYHQSDDNGTEADDGGYQIYDPSPNYQEHRPYGSSGDGNVNDLDNDMENFGSSRMNSKLSVGQNLLPSQKSSKQRFPTIMSMSSSMPDEIIRGGSATPMVSSSLHLSTASAASSNASSTAAKPGKSFVPKRLNNLFTSKHKRSGSNTSHKSTGSNIQNFGVGENNGSSSGGVNSGKPALSTIESGGSGSAGSYCITPPKNQNPTSSTTNVAVGGGYKLLDETANVSGLSDQFVDNKSPNETTKAISMKTESSLAKPSSVFKGLTTSANTNYQKLNKLSNTFSDETDLNTKSTYTPTIESSENPNYVVMNEPFKRPDKDTNTATTTPFEVGNISINPNYLTAAPNLTPMKSPTHSASSISDDDEDEDIAGEETDKERQIGEQIPMIPLQQHQQPRILPSKNKNVATTKPAASLLHRKQKQVRKPPPNGFIGPETT